jgi:hypothetical protein
VRRRYIRGGITGIFVIAVLGAAIGFAGGGVPAAVFAVIAELVLSAVFFPLMCRNLPKKRVETDGHSTR